MLFSKQTSDTCNSVDQLATLKESYIQTRARMYYEFIPIVRNVILSDCKIIMDKIPGPTLEEYILHHEGYKKLPLIYRKVRDALEALHNNGIIHGDTYLMNMMYWNDDLYLIDFGRSYDTTLQFMTTTQFEERIYYDIGVFAFQLTSVLYTDMYENPRDTGLSLHKLRWYENNYKHIPHLIEEHLEFPHEKIDLNYYIQELEDLYE